MAPVLAAQGGKNAVNNPSFEAGIANWEIAGDARGVTIDEAVGHTGKRSLRVTGATLESTGGAYQAIRFDSPVKRPLRVAAWSKAADVEVAGDYVILVHGTYGDGTKMEPQGARFEAGTHDWQYREMPIEAAKPLKSLEVIPVLGKGKGTVWFDDIAVTLTPIAFRGVRTATDLFGDASLSLVAGMTVPAPWKAELRGDQGVVATASGDGPPVVWNWTGHAGDYTLRLTGIDELEGNHAGELRKVRLGSPSSPRRGYAAWTESSMHRVLPQALPASGAALEGRIALAGNEYESFQICLLAAPGREVHNVRLQVSDLVSKATGKRIASSEMEWQQVGFVKVTNLRKSAANEQAWPGWWPDPLLPVKKFDLKPGFTQPVWVTVHAPAGTPAGEYTGVITVLADGEPPRAVAVEARVYGFTLPVQSHLKTAFALLGEELEQIYGKPLPLDIRRRFGDFLLRHRLNADDIYRKQPPDIEDLRHFQSHGLQGFNALYLIPPAGPLIPDLKAYTPVLRQQLIDRLDPFFGKLREAELSRRAYVYGFDESDPEFFDVMRDYFGTLKQRFAEVRTMTTAHLPLDPKVLRDLHVDWIVPLTPAYDYERAEECRRAGIQVWGYVGCGPGDPYANFLADDPLVEARVIWWQAFHQKMDGFLYWGVNIWERLGNHRPLDPARGPLLGWGVTTGKANDEEWLQRLHGDGLLVYPGVHGPIGSIRLANIRDGLEDYEYLWMLANQRRSLEAARQACLPGTRSLTQFTQDPAVLYAQRNRIAQDLMGR